MQLTQISNWAYCSFEICEFSDKCPGDIFRGKKGLESCCLAYVANLSALSTPQKAWNTGKIFDFTMPRYPKILWYEELQAPLRLKCLLASDHSSLWPVPEHLYQARKLWAVYLMSLTLLQTLQGISSKNRSPCDCFPQSSHSLLLMNQHMLKL